MAVPGGRIERIRDSLTSREWLQVGGMAFTIVALNVLGWGMLLLALRGHNFLWGPGRHALGANIFTYHIDPAGAVLEVTTGMIEIADEREWVTQVWSPDTPASAVMWGPYPPESFRGTSIAIHNHGER